MSFCSELKTELCAVKPHDCCEVAECYGLMLFSRSFSYKQLSIRTEHKEISELYSRYLKSNFAVFPGIKTGGKKVQNYTVTVDNPQECKRVMEAFGYLGGDLLEINHNVFKRDCCFGAFIRGAFLACGQMTDPYKNYHIEFVIKDLLLALGFYKLLIERGLSPKRSMRGNNTVIYFNKMETIQDILTVMGASSKVFELIDVQITKDIRNSENRKSNLEMGNIGKQVEASIIQRRAIEYLYESKKIYSLGENLQKVARLRMDNPQATLSELCKLSSEPITRSGLNHRLQKIIDFAEMCKKDLK